MAASLGAAVLTLNLPMRLAQVRTERWSVLDNAKEGFAAVKQAHGTGRVTLIFGSQFLVLGALDILIVVLGLEVLRLDDSGPGTLASGLGIGGLVGAAGTAMLVNRRRMAPAVVGGLVGLGLPLALIAVLAYGLAPAFALLALAGAGKSFVDVAGRTLLQRITPDRVLARVFGLQESLMMAGLAVGAAVAPVLIGWSSGRGAFFIMGALVIAVGLTQWLALLRLDSISILPGPGFELLAAIPMFSVLEQPDIEHLSRELVWMQAPAGAVVIKEGEAGDHFYLVESGIVSILKSGHEVNQLGRGSYFGETALLRNIPRTATVVAVTDADLYALDRRPFLEAVTGSPSSTVEAQRVMEERAGDSEPLADGL
ncbi:MAG: cyclic nucleotide-binding domain-containing protein [Acidimicrobiia bacterium]